MNSNQWKNESTDLYFPSAIFWGFFLFLVMVFNEGISSQAFTYSILLMSLFFFYLRVEKPEKTMDYAPFLFPMFGFFLYQGIMIFFAISPKFAYMEFSQLLLGFSILLLFLSLEKTVEEMLCSLLVASSISAFLSVDLISTRVFSGIFEKFTLILSTHYANLYGLEHGVRINSIFTAPNVFAGITGIAVLFSLAMVLQRQKPLERCFFLCCLFCNSLGFVLAFSLGATITLCVAFFLYLALEKNRISLLLLMLETFVVTLGSAFVVFLTSFQSIQSFNIVPLGCLFMGSGMLCLWHECLGRAFAQKLGGKEKILPYLMGGLLSGVLVFLLIATQWTGEITLQAGEYLRRSAYLDSGDYQLSVSANQPMNLLIESQTREETFQHLETVLYRGDTTDISFTVPEDSIVVYFRFQNPDSSVTITEAKLSSGETLNLRYLLLPGFVSTRLQGLFANENMNQRLIFFGDGMKLFWENPLFGSGMGAFAASLYRVQEFFYETLYVHNHYIQVLLEAGLIGFALFLLFVAMIALSLWAKRAEPFAIVSLVVLVFSLLHGAVEFTWSSGSYTVLLYGAFAVFHKIAKKNPAPKAVSTGIIGAIFLYGVLLAFNFNASYLVERSGAGDYEESLQTAIKLSPFEKNDYILSYLLYAIDSEDPAVQGRAEAYIPKLKVETSNSSGLYLAEFYFVQGRWQEGFSNLKHYLNNRSSSPEVWNTGFTILLAFQEDMEEAFFQMAISEVYQMMEDWDRENMGTAVLSTEIEAVILGYLSP